MWGEGNSPERRAQDRVEGRGQGMPGTDLAIYDCMAAFRRTHPALPSLRDALTAAIDQRVAQRAARDPGTHPPLVGHLCERCLDALAVLVQPAPWGGEMGVCAACQQEAPVRAEAPQAE